MIYVQVTLDTILSSGQTKWGRQVGLVLLLPHGLEGQGPEHSSAKIERYLELCDDDFSYLPTAEPGETIDQIMTRQLFEINWIICNLTTPANFFHVLRRQIHMPFRKPLVSEYFIISTFIIFIVKHKTRYNYLFIQPVCNDTQISASSSYGSFAFR